MPRTLQMRPLVPEERAAVEQLARSRTAPIREVERARVVLAAVEGDRVSAIANRFQLSKSTVCLWLGRFNAMGLAGLEDRPRSGRPRKYTAEQIAEVAGTAATAPATLGLPFASWTLDKLAAYLSECKGITLKRSRLNELLRAKEISWRAEGELVRRGRLS